MALKTYPWDIADHIETYEDVDLYLKGAREEEGEDPGLVNAILDAIVRSKAMSKLAAKWAADGQIDAYIREESDKTLEAYRSQPNLVAEHANIEEDTARGGYAHRQLVELVHNGADALSASDGGQIWVQLTPTHLYCADEGQPIDENGVRALMFSRLSPRRGTDEIGRFGLGFKSVLGVTDSPEFFSRSGSFRFDRASAAERIWSVAPDSERFPALRLPETIHPIREAATDPILREMMEWATNIVRLPLKQGAHQVLDKQIEEFPAEFLLLVEHVRRLVMQTDTRESDRVVTLAQEDDTWTLDNAGEKTWWMVEKRLHKLSSDAKSDSRSLDNADEVPIWWAAPIDRLNDPGKFWAFFPTQTTSLLAGILNAPWKTNEDRQSLLPGVYNDELIDAATQMVAGILTQLSTPEDPARHLDALPRRYESGDNEHSNRLRDRLYSILKGREIVPDQDGELQRLLEISYPPEGLPESALQRWEAYDNRPTDWVHHRVLTRNRVAVLERIIPSRVVHRWDGSISVESGLRHASITQWLEALVKNSEPDNSAYASMAAIQTAALIPQHIREDENLGNILLTAYGEWFTPNPDVVRLSGGSVSGSSLLVHPQLEADPETLSALKELGLTPASSETALGDLASRLLRPWGREMGTDADWTEFWGLVRAVDQSTAVEIIKSQTHWLYALRVRTIAGSWKSLSNALLPGSIVPVDGSRDSEIAIDTRFHNADLEVLRLLGAVHAPRAGYEIPPRGYLRIFKIRCRNKFTSPDRNLPSSPREDMVNFDKTTTSGPLEVLEHLSEDGNALYTWNLLSIGDTYEQWTMRHDTRDIYPPMDFNSPAVEMLRQHGRIKTDDGEIHKLSDGLGNPPQNWAVLNKLLSHPQTASIRRVFEISAEIDVPVEPVGEDGPIPLVDVWPGLGPDLSSHYADLEIVRCDGFRQLGDIQMDDETDCVIRNGLLYVTRKDDESDELRSVVRELGLQLSNDRIDLILLGLTDEDVKAAREAVRRCSTDEERLLAAVGEANLRLHLPQGLLAILEDTQESLSGIQMAQAAIATFHTGALREYRHALGRLDPPQWWAGTLRAVEFVQSLGFSEEWAGDRNTRRDPYIEVEGPYSLPLLHDYQRSVVENIKGLIRSNGALGERRGMVSMPTGSGKTRVAVQSIVEAIRDDDFKGGILWVADRDELCEQAVEAWRQVWASEGKEATQLRISRMWAEQSRPLPSSEMHVIVASIQTLVSKIKLQPDAYEFLKDFDLLVFDEAHRSITSTSTSVMAELGLTRWRRPDEPLLIGLTATPYRGYDESETERLVNRYGRNRLDAGAFHSDDPEDVIRELQDMQVLAQADHDIIEGGRFFLNPDEQRLASNVPWLPESVERRIAGDTVRTQRIVQEYMDRIDPDWPTLIFATSVEHAQTVSALLNSRGVKSRAVSGSTDRSIRRRVVEEFRNGDVKALVNYAVFREGFDAPRTRAIIVARPVYSPNLYFQMIGRGLRGIKNGGNDRCLILNVRDNIDNFERRLAFSDLDWLWA